MPKEDFSYRRIFAGHATAINYRVLRIMIGNSPMYLIVLHGFKTANYKNDLSDLANEQRG